MINTIKYSLDNLPCYEQLKAYVDEDDLAPEVYNAIRDLLNSKNPKSQEVREIVEGIIKGIQQMSEVYGNQAEQRITEMAKNISISIKEKLESDDTAIPSPGFDSIEIKVKPFLKKQESEKMTQKELMRELVELIAPMFDELECSLKSDFDAKIKGVYDKIDSFTTRYASITSVKNKIKTRKFSLFKNMVTGKRANRIPRRRVNQ